MDCLLSREKNEGERGGVGQREGDKFEWTLAIILNILGLIYALCYM